MSGPVWVAVSGSKSQSPSPVSAFRKYSVDMRRFMVPSARPLRPEGVSEGPSPAERARAFAEGIGLAWPWKAPAGPGRPCIQTVYERTLAQLLQRRDFEALQGVSSTKVPAAWREGMPVGAVFEDVLQAEASHMLAFKSEHKAADTEQEEAAAAAADGEEERQTKRKKKNKKKQQNLTQSGANHSPQRLRSTRRCRVVCRVEPGHASQA